MDHDALQERLGYRFGDPDRLTLALTHRSNMSTVGRHNETLEFLGDSVLGLAVSDLLIRRWPDADEGQLSRRRASLVNARVLAEKALGLDLGSHISIGRGEEKTGGREKQSILADTLEAVIGAAYLDGGFEAGYRIVQALFEGDVGEELQGVEGDWKTQLQELAQKRYRSAPVYELIHESGPDHAKDFGSRVSVGGRILGAGRGASKKRAEQAAAREALHRLEAETPAVEASGS